ncbi:MAG: hypothetical protein IKV03_04765 [Alphaproteobacteria bacterium]|nr:hypothetical protein [Alphaproteobacteria bacterium]
MTYIQKINHIIFLVFLTTLLSLTIPAKAKKLEIIIGGENFCKTSEDCHGNAKCHTGIHICIDCPTPPFVWNGTTCSCPEDTVLKDENTCVQCLSDDDCTDNKETPYCNTNTNMCFNCPDTFERQGNTCVCPIGTHEFGGICVCDNENKTLDADGFCSICNIQEKDCINSDFSGNTDCHCCPTETPFWNSSTCSACPANTPVYKNGRCECQESLSCAGNETCFGGACIACPNGQVRSATEFECHCPTEKPVWDGKNCITCAEATNDQKTVYNPQTKTCVECMVNEDCGTDQVCTKNQCQCKAGTIFVNGQCVKTWCVPSSDSGLYECSIMQNGKSIICGAYCQDTKMEKDSCVGYCSSRYCEGIGEYGSKRIPLGGLGCLEDNGPLYCNWDWRSPVWKCMRKDGSGNMALCCNHPTQFGECENGTCYPEDCKKIGGTEADWSADVSEGYGGCKISKKGYSAYCVPWPRSSDTWVCMREKAPGITTGTWSAGYCGTCSSADLKSTTGGDCSKCFNTPTCPTGSTYNANINRCIWDNFNGQQVSCNFAQYCYVGLGNEQCCRSQYSTPSACITGRCSAKDPKDPKTPKEGVGGTCNKFIYNSKLNYWGCWRSLFNNDGLFYRDGAAGTDYACYYGSSTTSNGKTVTTANTLCGSDCDANCNNCQVVYHEKCAGTYCSTYGGLIDANNDDIQDCQCIYFEQGKEVAGSITNGHCCLPGHIYVNGACQLITCSTETCLSNSLCVKYEKENGIERSSQGLCICTNDKECYDTQTNSCVSTSDKIQKDGYGWCSYLE